jgi:hypothetical protein
MAKISLFPDLPGKSGLREIEKGQSGRESF